MTLSKKLRAFVEEAKATDGYWVESAKLEFALRLEQQRRKAGITYAALAKKIGASAAYVSKVFRGDTNLTIESMVKLARATGGQLDIRIVNNAITSVDWKPVSKRGAHLILVQSSTPVVVSAVPANDHLQWERSAA